MGICDSVLNDSYDSKTKLVKIDGEIKDISSDYLFPDSLAKKTPITDKYELTESILGKGLTGIVLTGKDKRGKFYAIKCIKKKKILNAQHLINEARIGLSLNHPHIIKIKEIFEDKKKISFIMDLCEGGDLFDFITKSPGKKLLDRDSIYIFIQILDSLNYLHNKMKICHRDIKPENFLVSIDENNRPFVRLIDFGFAHYIDQNQKMTECLGTLSYTAPEVIMKKPYDEKIDIWSAGILFFNMLTGCEPFSGRNREELKKNIVFGSICFNAIRNNHLREFCQKLLEKNPMKRIDALSALNLAKNIERNFTN